MVNYFFTQKRAKNNKEGFLNDLPVDFVWSTNWSFKRTNDKANPDMVENWAKGSWHAYHINNKFNQEHFSQYDDYIQMQS